MNSCWKELWSDFRMNFSICIVAARVKTQAKCCCTREKFQQQEGKWNKKAITRVCRYAQDLHSTLTESKKVSCWSSEYLWANTWNRCQFVNLRQAFWKELSDLETRQQQCLITCKTSPRSWSHFVLKMDVIGRGNGQYQLQISSNWELTKIH